MKIISDTGPLIGLAKIDRLPILKDIAAEILIPPVALASILSEDVLLLMDDRAGRVAAAKLGIPTTGLISFYAEASI